MENLCDHTSVGVLVWKKGRLLLIQRKKTPHGFAPPAGHVDSHGSFRDAAIAELREEVGLRATDVKLVALGRKENPCRRKGGNWHYWHIYLAQVEGSVVQCVDEVETHRWVDEEELGQLAVRTEEYLGGQIAQSDWETTPGLEPVWYDWLHELQLIPTSKNFPTSLKTLISEPKDFDAARQYAWEWFQYHAEQRQTVFRFFLTIVAILAAGYATAWSADRLNWAAMVSILLIICPILFWRLDERNRNLVKISERYLSVEENRLLGSLL